MGGCQEVRCFDVSAHGIHKVKNESTNLREFSLIQNQFVVIREDWLIKPLYVWALRKTHVSAQGFVKVRERNAKLVKFFFLANFAAFALKK